MISRFESVGEAPGVEEIQLQQGGQTKREAWIKKDVERAIPGHHPEAGVRAEAGRRAIAGGRRGSQALGAMAGGKSKGGSNKGGKKQASDSKGENAAGGVDSKSRERPTTVRSGTASERRLLGNDEVGSRKPRGILGWLEYKYMQYNVTRSVVPALPTDESSPRCTIIWRASLR